MALPKKVKSAIRPGSAPLLMVLSGLVGVSAGLGAVVLIRGIEFLAEGTVALAEATGWGRAWVFVAVPLGLWLAWRVAAWLAPEAAGHGVPHIIEAIAVRGGEIKAVVAPTKIVTTVLTIGSGGSAGREGPIAQIGAALGSLSGRLAGLGESERRVLVAAGAGAGISATFNAPIAGMFFAMEVILGKLSVRHLHTVVVASVIGAVVSRSILGEALTFSVTAYSLEDPAQLVLYGLLGLLTVGFGWLFLQTLDWSDTIPNRIARWLRPLALGGLVAGIGFAWPELLGTGQVFIGGILRNEIDYAWWALGGLAILKAFATSATLGGKGSGGIFMPSLFIGAAVGAGFAKLILPYWQLSLIEPGAFALVGMSATFAVIARAPLTAILIVFETTGDYGLVLPLMVATAISAFVATRVRPESAYIAPLTRKGIHPTGGTETDLLDTVTVGDIVRPTPEVLPPDASLGEAQGILHRRRLHGLPVVDNGRLIGVVAESDISRAGGPSDAITVAEAMTPDPVTVTPSAAVSEALARMAALGIGRLPVVSEAHPDRLVGMFGREDVVRAYHKALGTSARAQKRPEQLTIKTGDQAGFFEFEIPNGSIADGRRVREIPWPEGCLLVSVHRGTSLLIATGTTFLHSGDAITAFGDREARSRLERRLGARDDGRSGSAATE